MLSILVVSAAVERIWEYFQQAVPERYLTKRVKILGAGILSVAAALSFKLDLIYTMDLTDSYSIAGAILTGFSIAVGSNVIHDLVGIVNGIKSDHKPIDDFEAGM